MDVGFDFETHRFREGLLAPPPVCLTWCLDGDDDQGQIAKVYDRLEESLEMLLYGEDLGVRVAQFAAFDLAVIVTYRPEYMSRVFELLETGQVLCTKVREKLLNLTLHGNISDLELPDGSTTKILYSLSDLVMEHFGVDISASKKGDDAWRTNYQLLEDVPLSEWPSEAIEYAKDDASWVLKIYKAQETKREAILEQTGKDPFEVQEFRTCADFCLYLMSMRGFRIDPVEKGKIDVSLQEALKPENMRLMIQEGILIPATPGRPYANGAKNEDGTLKTTKPTKEKVNKKKLIAYVERVAKEKDGIELRYTEPSTKFPNGQLSLTAEFWKDHYDVDSLFEEYRNRAKLQQLVTTEMPRLCDPETGETAKIVHPCYDVLKRTGRTSSFASKLYPSLNVQNVNPKVRPCYIPREGTKLFSVDYVGMELGTTAQKCLDLFGKSVMAEKINAGVDLHAHLGAQIAYELDPEFRCICDDEGIGGDRDQVYEAFVSLKDEGDDLAKFYKHYRTFAKPTGLGYPGGLGPATFVAYAKATYGIIVDEATATMLRNTWKDTYPEMQQYFDYLNSSCKDPNFHGKYCYSTPMGMYRANTNYCAAANGGALQAPSAEGAVLSVINVNRACYDPAMENVLLGGCWPIGFIHDELVGEVLDDGLLTERVHEVGRIMVDSMAVITPDVQPRVEVALMDRWYKSAEAQYSSSGQLEVWVPAA